MVKLQSPKSLQGYPYKVSLLLCRRACSSSTSSHSQDNHELEKGHQGNVPQLLGVANLSASFIYKPVTDFRTCERVIGAI